MRNFWKIALGAGAGFVAGAAIQSKYDLTGSAKKKADQAIEEAKKKFEAAMKKKAEETKPVDEKKKPEETKGKEKK